tara:strand:- start:23894 stop:25042 length:1149 start_codon:yes stop_codon:yes gene_type:complete
MMTFNVLRPYYDTIIAAQTGYLAAYRELNTVLNTYMSVNLPPIQSALDCFEEGLTYLGQRYTEHHNDPTHYRGIHAALECFARQAGCLTSACLLGKRLVTHIGAERACNMIEDTQETDFALEEAFSGESAELRQLLYNNTLSTSALLEVFKTTRNIRRENAEYHEHHLTRTLARIARKGGAKLAQALRVNAYEEIDDPTTALTTARLFLLSQEPLTAETGADIVNLLVSKGNASAMLTKGYSFLNGNAAAGIEVCSLQAQKLFEEAIHAGAPIAHIPLAEIFYNEEEYWMAYTHYLKAIVSISDTELRLKATQAILKLYIKIYEEGYLSVFIPTDETNAKEVNLANFLTELMIPLLQTNPQRLDLTHLSERILEYIETPSST